MNLYFLLVVVVGATLLRARKACLREVVLLLAGVGSTRGREE